MDINESSQDISTDIGEEVTWQDDENRATLLLRSVFVLLSGALTLGSQLRVFSDLPQYFFFSSIALILILPLCIIWFFFGQGLRPVEWLTDQKYNAWNYGFNFKEWKLHLKWTLIFSGGIVLFALASRLFFPVFVFGAGNSFMAQLLGKWLLGVICIWFFYSYLLFGMGQGFGFIGALLGVIVLIPLAYGQLYYSTNVTVGGTLYPLPFIVLGWVCWKAKSIAPALYSLIIAWPLILLILW